MGCRAARAAGAVAVAAAMAGCGLASGAAGSGVPVPALPVGAAPPGCTSSALAADLPPESWTVALASSLHTTANFALDGQQFDQVLACAATGAHIGLGAIDKTSLGTGLLWQGRKPAAGASMLNSPLDAFSAGADAAYRRLAALQAQAAGTEVFGALYVAGQYLALAPRGAPLRAVLLFDGWEQDSALCDMFRYGRDPADCVAAILAALRQSHLQTRLGAEAFVAGIDAGNQAVQVGDTQLAEACAAWQALLQDDGAALNARRDCGPDLPGVVASAAAP